METVKKFIKEHPHMWWGLHLPVYLTMFFFFEHLITDNFWATQTAIDDYIPFCEWFIFPYDAWAFLLVAIGLYLIVKDGEGFRRYMWPIMITFTTATVFCALVPTGQDLRPAVMEHHNIAAWLLQNTYALDTNTNVFPSVHVLGVIAAVSAVWHTPGLRKWGWRAGSLALGSGKTRGVDADVSDAVSDENLDSAVAFVKDFAQRSHAIVAVTGAIDLVSDGQRCFVIRNGRPEMGKITGTGCQLSALTAAFVTANPGHPLEAAAAAVCALCRAGETAH